MNCEQVREQLIALILGDLSEAAEMDVRGHLLTCEECNQEFEAFKALQQGIDSLPDAEPSPAFKSRVLTRFRIERKNSYSDRLRTISGEGSFASYFVKWLGLQVRRPAGLIAAAVVIGVLGSFAGFFFMPSPYPTRLAGI